MYESVKSDLAVTMDAKSVASGLSPPYASAITYQQCRQFVDDILLVIVSAAVRLYEGGLVVEPSEASCSSCCCRAWEGARD
ncbi:hypothetical protein LSAT2_001278 [Lamellibrachia satsuma]|nr:hypothetical protein LSAT2_001278 [Lamellibrachia satsuma]